MFVRVELYRTEERFDRRVPAIVRQFHSLAAATRWMRNKRRRRRYYHVPKMTQILSPQDIDRWEKTKPWEFTCDQCGKPCEITIWDDQGKLVPFWGNSQRYAEFALSIGYRVREVDGKKLVYCQGCARKE